MTERLELELGRLYYMTKDQLIKELEAASLEREKLFKKREPIDVKIKSNYELIDRLKDKITALEVKEPKSLEEKIEYFLFEDGNVSSTRYKERDKFWNDFCGNLGLNHSGYYPFTKQIRLQVKLTYGSEESLKLHKDQIIKLLPFIKVDKDDYKVFGIFEHTLSRYCSYHFLVNEDKNEYTVKTHYGEEVNFPSLKVALKYIQKHHYYDGKDTEEE